MVGALVYRQDGRCLVLRRSADKDFEPGIWECVTGRVDQGESFTHALHREVMEELGVEIQVDFILGTTHFYRGSKKPEYEMLGVLYACTVEGSERIRTGIEHSEHRWVSAAEAEKIFRSDYWLLEAIRRAEVMRSGTPADLRALLLEGGFEI